LAFFEKFHSFFAAIQNRHKKLLLYTLFHAKPFYVIFKFLFYACMHFFLQMVTKNHIVQLSSFTIGQKKIQKKVSPSNK